MTRVESTKSTKATHQEAPAQLTQEAAKVKVPRKLKADKQATQQQPQVTQPVGQPDEPKAEPKTRKPRANNAKAEPKAEQKDDVVKVEAAKVDVSKVDVSKVKAAKVDPTPEVKARKPRAKQLNQPATDQQPTVQQPASEPTTAEPHKEPSKKSPGAKPKTKRQPSDKKSKFEAQGVGIAPSRVKSVLSSVALNPREARARVALRQAENRPVLPKQVKDGPAPVLPPQGPQKHIAELEADVQAVINEAETAHTASLREEYEHKTVASWSIAEREQYKAAKVAAKKTEDFNTQAFNTSFKPKFYDGFAAHCAADSYSTTNAKYNEWNRATALVNKLCVRLSQGTRDILAAYLDNVVLQYATNAVFNCQASGKTTVKLEHALAELDGFSTRVPLAPWVRTLPSYLNAVSYASQKAAADALDNKVDNKAAAANSEPANTTANVEQSKTEYTSVHEDNKIFKSYIEDLCLYVQSVQKSSLNLSTNFKRFCADLVYSAILRVADCLKQNVSFSGVKTISDGLMRHTIECIHTADGIDSTALMADLDQRLAKFEAFRGPQTPEEEDEIISV
jgi:hypothetical protein